MLRGENITVRYGERAVVDGVSFHLKEGQWLMLAGPNGAGKSTLIEAIAQGVAYSGSIEWEGQDLRRMKPAQLAQRIGVLSQKNTVGYAYTVEEVAGLGRYAYRAGFLNGRAGFLYPVFSLTLISPLPGFLSPPLLLLQVFRYDCFLSSPPCYFPNSRKRCCTDSCIMLKEAPPFSRNEG